MLTVQCSSSADVIRVNDIDGEFRYYSAATGSLLSESQKLSDWKEVRLDRDFGFSYRGHDFVLAEPIAQREFQRLYCRFIPRKGYFLWWQKVARPDDFFKSRGMIPLRAGISATASISWKPLESGSVDIRD